MTKYRKQTPKGVNTTRRDKRARRQIRFMLDAANETDRVIGQSLIDRKAKKQMTPTIRKALRLYLALEAGQMEVLFEMFPATATMLRPSAGDDFSTLMAEIAAMRRQMENAATPESNVRRPELPPKQDEPEITISKAKKTSAQEVGANFLKAASSFGFFD